MRWSKAWDGGYASGHDEVRDYWTRQWQEVDAHVEPTAIQERADGRFEVTVHQVVKDKKGNVLFTGSVLHVYTVQDGLLKQMDIEQGSTLASTNTEA